MNSKEILYSSGGNDECYTPDYGVYPILKFIINYEYEIYQKDKKDIMNLEKRNMIVWCPFDKFDSEFVKQISTCMLVDVVYSHIDNGQDFYTYEPPVWDIMISNPPFTNKRKIFERALSFGKPFALIMSNTWLNDSAPKQLFKEKQLQLLMFDKRMKFIKPDGSIEKKITFSSSYYCWNFLPKDLIMDKLTVKDKR
jgi:hypothetical protein